MTKPSSAKKLPKEVALLTCLRILELPSSPTARVASPARPHP